MFSQWFVDAAQVLVLVFLAVLIFKYLKMALIVATGTVGKATDDHETVNLNVNFSLFDSRATMKKKIDLLCELGDERKAFTHQRFMSLIEQEQQKQKGPRSVKGGSEVG